MNEQDTVLRAEKLLGELCAQGLRLHGAMLARAGRPLLEAYFSPGERDTPHILYSVSKSVTSLAVGILLGRGQIDLDARAGDLFPEWTNADTPREAMDTTLRDMLRMTTCHTHRAHVPGQDARWGRAFFREAAHRPGEGFGYDSTGTQLLTELCRRITGKSMLAFLQPALFDPIGATDEKTWLTDEEGVEQGGSGLHMTLRDLCKTACFCLSDGLGIVPESYLRAATSFQTDTSMKTGDQRFGYGYQFWMLRRGFAMLGMDGQMALILPGEQLVFCTLGDTRGQEDAQQRMIDAFFAQMPAREGDGE